MVSQKQIKKLSLIGLMFLFSACCTQYIGKSESWKKRRLELNHAESLTTTDPVKLQKIEKENQELLKCSS